MQRRKPISTKKKKEAQKLKRAIKRGDVDPPEKPSTAARRKGKDRGGKPTSANPGRLESSFVKLSPEFLEKIKILASTQPLPRPLANNVAILSLDQDPGLPPLSCPRRPKWKYDQEAKQVHANEEGIFKKWLAETDGKVEQWRGLDTDSEVWPRSVSHFERNLEVWRQLWRVTEISQVVLVLVDSRCPAIHFPSSLAQYLNVPDKKVILVLTKVDISGPERAQAWTDWLRAQHPGIRVVQVESYAEKPEGWSAQGKKMYEPHLPRTFRERLVEAIKDAHQEMLQPPEAVRNNERRLQYWRPPVKRDIDWQAVLEAQGGQVGVAVGGAAAPMAHNEDEEDSEPQFLTVGLIGQPNVGKSSLLNAIFGTHKVRASRTPGKTKHFQTLFWTPELRLVDCPGLVMPSYIPMEMQVMTGILPISRVSAVATCIHHASTLLPLETVLRLTHPKENEQADPDKRTWRDDAQRERMTAVKETAWTAMDVMTAYALKKGWVTAKAGRPDVNRAGNAILRALAENRIKWAFWPPGTDAASLPDSNGIWIGDQNSVDSEEEAEESEEEEGPAPSNKSEDSEDQAADEPESEEEEDFVIASGGTRFDMLSMDSRD